MLKIVKRMKLKGAQNPAHGSVQFFMERLLVDVAAANYRYFLNEHLNKGRLEMVDPEKACHAPLLDNEEQVSGLFSSALSGFCPVFRPEFPVERPGKKTPGHVDFMVTHGDREIGLENKMVKVASVTHGGDIPKLQKRWHEVVTQAQNCYAFMSREKERFRHPVSIGLLMVRLSRKVTESANPKQKAEEALKAGLEDLRSGAEQLGKTVGQLGARSHAHFVAVYEYPREMQIMSGWKLDKVKGGERVFPGVVFLGHVATRNAPQD